MLVCLYVSVNWSNVVLSVSLHSAQRLFGSFRFGLNRSSHSDNRGLWCRGGGGASVVTVVVTVGVVSALWLIAVRAVVGSLGINILVVVGLVSAVTVIVSVTALVVSVSVLSVIVSALTVVVVVVVVLSRTN